MSTESAVWDSFAEKVNTITGLENKIPDEWSLVDPNTTARLEDKDKVELLNSEGERTIECYIYPVPNNKYHVGIKRCTTGPQKKWYKKQTEYFSDIQRAVTYAIGLMYRKRDGYIKSR